MSLHATLLEAGIFSINELRELERQRGKPQWKTQNCRNCGAPYNDNGCQYCGTGVVKKHRNDDYANAVKQKWQRMLRITGNRGTM